MGECNNCRMEECRGQGTVRKGKAVGKGAMARELPRLL